MPSPKAKGIATELTGALKLVHFPEPEPVFGAEFVEAVTDQPFNSLALPAKFKSKVEELYSEHDALSQQIKALEAEKKQVAEDLGKLLDKQKLRSISSSDIRVQWVHSHNSTINKLALLSNGVSSAVIAASTKKTPFRRLSVVNVELEAANREAKQAEKGSEEGE